ncbi:hypothetical protein K466DRAFT_519873 [Polyporus arcularius HHB13444]|uniref:F-box domain-containing protein n=1 Tax=Polyporus arcularius HHB13444 TaxID=1314778 RepID=A0A5C3PIM7_9APHY|nr:hypothetical protein K466DRAFT_519873 [Polyporus arcularius HHB13444]
MTTSKSTLPPELWAMVIHQLSKDDQRNLLFVSTFFHDLALSDVFSHVTIRFGLWRPDASDYNVVTDDADTPPPPMTEDQRAETALVNLHACEILHHIARTPRFARVIKKLSIRAYVAHSGDGVFELFALKEAVLAMTHITSFRWDGRNPLPNFAVLDALAQSSGHVVRELILPSSDETRTFLAKFQRLQTLVLHRPYDPDYMLLLPDDSDVSISDGIEANQNTLARLTLYGDALWRCPVRSLLDLQELEIILPPSLAGLELVLHHCTTLRYVTFDLHVCTNARLLELLKTHPDSLPQLTAFKLFFEQLHPLTHAEVTLLAEFLKGKKTLRMLDLADTDADMEEGTEVPILKILPELPALEVLGLNIQCFEFSHGEFQVLRTHLPPRLSALFLNLTVDGTVSRQDWIDLLSNLTSLRYLHIIDMLDNMDLKQQLLEDHPDSLELVGYDMHLRWLEHDPEQDAPRYSPRWSTEKVRFCTAEDFGCKDWEWLFRYHAPRGLWDRHNLTTQ